MIDHVEKLESSSSVSKLVSHELEAAFHPRCLFVWYREGDKPNLTLSYSSGGYIHAAELAPASPLLQLAERAGGIIELPLDAAEGLPPAERAWLDDAGVRLIVPMPGAERQLAGLLMLGDKKSEEPYSADDLKLLQAIARQIARRARKRAAEGAGRRGPPPAPRRAGAPRDRPHQRPEGVSDVRPVL